MIMRVGLRGGAAGCPRPHLGRLSFCQANFFFSSILAA